MKKIPTLFMRDYTNIPKQLTNKINPICQWVMDGDGWPTRKYDGTCCMIKDGKLYKRYESKKEPPDDFIPAQDPDQITKHWVGWRPCNINDPSDKYHWIAFENLQNKIDGTYELIGPKVQGNPEKHERHELIRHDDIPELTEVIRTFDGLREYLSKHDIEGIVFHSSDGKMCKIKKRDFGIKR